MKADLNFKIPFGKYKGLTINTVLTDLPEEYGDESIIRMAKLGFKIANGEDAKFNLRFNDLDYIIWLVTILKQGVTNDVHNMIKTVSLGTHTIGGEPSGDMMTNSLQEGYV